MAISAPVQDARFQLPDAPSYSVSNVRYQMIQARGGSYVSGKKELLRKCFDLFGQHGFNNVTMRQIASENGVSTGTLYHYFPTKLDVLEQLFAWAVEEDIEAYSAKAVIMDEGRIVGRAVH